MSQLEVIMTKGLPASGKSTWAKEFMKKNPKYKRINKDDLRAMLDDSAWSKDNEKFIIATRDDIIKLALNKGYNVIVDDTNFSDNHEKRIQAIIHEYCAAVGNDGVKFSIKDFTDVPVQECLKRDKLRAKPVGDKVILMMHNQYLSERACEALQDVKKARAVCFDIDGTIADHNGIRGHYDLNMYTEDKVVHHVAKHLGFYKNEGTTVIILTARDEDGREQTETWLEKHKLPYDALVMRRAGDERSDFIAKKEMLQELMKTYFIEACYEDRLRNVNMMRDELGLNVFHVAAGLF